MSNSPIEQSILASCSAVYQKTMADFLPGAPAWIREQPRHLLPVVFLRTLYDGSGRQSGQESLSLRVPNPSEEGLFPDQDSEKGQAVLDRAIEFQYTSIFGGLKKVVHSTDFEFSAAEARPLHSVTLCVSAIHQYVMKRPMIETSATAFDPAHPIGHVIRPDYHTDIVLHEQMPTEFLSGFVNWLQSQGDQLDRDIDTMLEKRSQCIAGLKTSGLPHADAIRAVDIPIDCLAKERRRMADYTAEVERMLDERGEGRASRP